MPVVVFSPELPAEQLVMKMLASLGRIDQQRMRTGLLDPGERSRLASQAARLDGTDIFIVDHSALTPSELRACCLGLHRAHGLGLVVVDYLQCMRVPGAPETGELAGRADIAELSRSLKALASEMSVPVVACSQLNRSLEWRANKRPVMSDLRDVGAIEHDADLVVFIYRDEGRAFIHPRLSWRTGRLATGESHRRHAGYCRERRQPAARASPSVQNHRSPFDVLIRVCS